MFPSTSFGDSIKLVNEMKNDPIVAEVRKAGEDLAKKANYNLHVFFENIRRNEKKGKHIIVSRDKRKI